jgi:phage baseplate assembly protein W
MSGPAVRTAAQLDQLWRRLGTDLELGWSGPAGSHTDADLDVIQRPGHGYPVLDLAVAERTVQATQMLVNRLMTRAGELAPLGHPEYGSRHHELIGEPNTDRTRNLVKTYVLQALRHEPRIARVERCTVTAGDRPRDTVRIELTIRLIDLDDPLNLVVSFALGEVT